MENTLAKSIVWAFAFYLIWSMSWWRGIDAAYMSYNAFDAKTEVVDK